MHPWQDTGATAGALIGGVTGVLLWVRYFPKAEEGTREDYIVFAMLLGCVFAGGFLGKLVDYCLGH